jgi:hypothetical protein
MLARIEESIFAGEKHGCSREREKDAFNEEMSVIANLLDSLFDYAGLFPPASLDLPAVVRNYLCYRQGRHADALGRLIVDFNRAQELRTVAGERLREIGVSLIASSERDLDGLLYLLDTGLPIDAIEIKANAPSGIERIARRLPVGLTTYFEVPVEAGDARALDAICAAAARVKLRMGGMTAEAFPSPRATAGMLQALADRHLMFKATAGLHHPLRSIHPFEDSLDSAVGTMHGFVNLCCAAAIIHLGGDAIDAALILEETDQHAWQISPEAIAWREFRWSALQMEDVRREFFCSMGSCSFTQPFKEMETMRWL